MLLWRRKLQLKKKFKGKRCRVKGQSDMPLKLVRDIGDMTGPPSGWTWQSNLLYDDGTESIPFRRLRDVEVEK